MHVLYIELSYTGSLDQSTRLALPLRPRQVLAVIVPIFFVLCLKHIVFAKLHLLVWVCSLWWTDSYCAVLYMELSYTVFLDQSTRASEHVMFRLAPSLRLRQVLAVVVPIYLFLFLF